MKGIIIACPQKYEHFCLSNIKSIRMFGCNLPIEIWEINNEVSANIKAEMEKIDNIYFRNINEFTSNTGHWKGFQIKAYILYVTKFEEVILCDADMTFFKNPEIIFDDPNYIETGAYFFKDLDCWQFHDLTATSNDKFRSIKFFNNRKKFIRKILPVKSTHFPEEWSYIYDENIPTNSVKEALQESGVVYINKNIHAESIKHIYTLNYNHNITYNYVWGDKETFWLGCLMANQSFFFNSSSGYMSNNSLTHDYNGSIFWKQK